MTGNEVPIDERGGPLSPSAEKLRARLKDLQSRRAPLRTRGYRLLVTSISGVVIASLLGLAEWAWPFLVIPLGLHVIAQGRVYAPRALLLWIGFAGWATVAVVSAGDGYMPLLTYAAATVAFLFTFNLPEDELADAVVIRAVAGIWLVLAVSGLIGVATGATEFPSLGATVLSPSPESDVDVLTQVRFADPLKPGEPGIGWNILDHRPNGILPFANHWGSAIVMFLGAVLVLRIQYRDLAARWWLDGVAILTVVPFVLSRNRWAWVTVPVVVLYFIARYWRPNPILARTLLVGIVLASVAVLVSPLRGVIEDRSQDQTGNRPDQYELSLELVADAPFFGYGTIQVGENEDGEERELGADSQILYSLVSYGVPATVLLFGWFVVIALASRKADTPIDFVTHFAIVVLLLQAPFYVFVPHRLMLLMLLAGAVFRRVYTDRTGRHRPLLLVASQPHRVPRRRVQS